MLSSLARPLPICSEHCWAHSWHCSPNHNRSVTTYREAVVPCRCHQGQSLGGGPLVPNAPWQDVPGAFTAALHCWLLPGHRRPTALGLPPAESCIRAVAGYDPRDSPSSNDSFWCGNLGCYGPFRVSCRGLHHQCQVSAFRNLVLVCSTSSLVMHKQQMYVHVCVCPCVCMCICMDVYIRANA